MKVCPNCKKNVEDDAVFCGYCAQKIPLDALIRPEESMDQNASQVSAKDSYQTGEKRERYPALRAIIGYYETMAMLVAVASALICVGAIFVSLKAGNLLVGIVIAAAAGVMGGVLFITMRAMAESITVIIDIEANTRRLELLNK